MSLSTAIVLSQPTGQVYYSINENDHDQQRHKRLINKCQRLWLGASVVTLRGGSTSNHFDILIECQKLVINPLHVMLHPRQVWEIQMFFRLNRLIWVVTPDDVFVGIKDLESVGLHPNSKSCDKWT